jgi:hypothetical protein
LATKGHVESNGQSERSIQSQVQHLRIYWNRVDKLSSLLPKAEFLHNNSKNKTTGFTPHYMEFGRHPEDEREIQTERNESDLLEIHKQAKQNMKIAQESMCKYLNPKRKKQLEFTDGELI